MRLEYKSVTYKEIQGKSTREKNVAKPKQVKSKDQK